MSSTAHKIGLVTATIIGMNAMIGAGIFTATEALSSNVGPAGILAYIFVVVAIWFMASALARLAQLFPEEGSFYTYAKQWGGHTVGMIAISLYFLGLVVGMGLLTWAAGDYLSKIFPTISATTLSLILLTILIVINMFGVKMSKLGQHILIGLTLFPLAAITLMCFAKGSLSNFTPFAPYGLGNVMKATSKVIFGFFGFECAASLYNIVKNPERNVPKALTLAIVLVGALYTIFVTSIVAAIPLEMLSQSDMVLTDKLIQLFPTHPWIIYVIHLSILSAIIGTVHSMIWSSSHLVLLLVDKIKNPTLHNLKTSGVLNHRTSVLLVGALMGTAFLSISNVSLFLYITAFSIVLCYILSMITLLVRPDEWKSGRNIKTMIGFITAWMIFYFAADGIITEISKLL